MRKTYRILALVAVVAMLLSALAVPALAGSSGTLLSRINNSRANAGLPPVEMYWDLTDNARAHTDAMIAAGNIYHNPSLSGVTGVWHALGENVGVGTDANQLHDAFMASSGHRANILGNFNYVGIGAKTDDQGFVWATVIFMRADPGLNGPAETTTTAPPTTTTTTPSTPLPGTPDAPATTTTSPAVVKASTGTATEPSDNGLAQYTSFGRPGGLPAIAI